MARIIAWLMSFNKQLTIAVVLIASYSAVYYIAQANQRARTAEQIKVATLEGVRTHAKTEQEVIQLSDSELDSRMSKWLRD